MPRFIRASAPLYATFAKRYYTSRGGDAALYYASRHAARTLFSQMPLFVCCAVLPLLMPCQMCTPERAMRPPAARAIFRHAMLMFYYC